MENFQVQALFVGIVFQEIFSHYPEELGPEGMPSRLQQQLMELDCFCHYMYMHIVMLNITHQEKTIKYHHTKSV